MNQLVPPTIEHPLADGVPPSWATEWGQDRFGIFAECAVPLGDRQVTQRLRWIPPGTFTMGSPSREPGWKSDEGPEHEVTLTSGFWIFDTPCTQALWNAVMPKNPSRFPDDERPVEQVTWHECQEFVQRFDELHQELSLTLPTEAQWEYACRAGTGSAIYTGKIKIVGTNNAPSLDAIAWYGGNSGVNFDRTDGHSSKDWREKQFRHSQAGTRKVARKLPNAFGLFDMLGNVYEWCQDGQRSYTSAAVSDPLGGTGDQEKRVIRGGGWDSNARLVRAAARDVRAPSDRSYLIGFRCVAVDHSGE